MVRLEGLIRGRVTKSNAPWPCLPPSLPTSILSTLPPSFPPSLTESVPPCLPFSLPPSLPPSHARTASTIEALYYVPMLEKWHIVGLWIHLKHGVHTHDWASLRCNSTVANKSIHDWTTYTVTKAHSGLAIRSSHLIDRKVRANSQEEVTPQKAFSPDANKITTLSKIRCHASDVATKKPANKVELMAYNLRRLGKFCD